MKFSRSHIGSILFWSVVSAAFIGPGTVVTCLTAGKDHQYSLLWTLLFATLACLLLQEAVARIALISGKSLGEVLGMQFSNRFIPVMAGLIVIFGCAAYQAGNLLGAVWGINQQFQFDSRWLTTGIIVIAGSILYTGHVNVITRLLGVVVALMGAGFIILALNSDPSPAEIATGLIPSVPPGSQLLIIGLIGTTIVPYNLFLGSGITAGQSIRQMRIGLTGAIILGGLISIAILLSGTLIHGENYYELTGEFEQRIGSYTSWLYAFGLFGAGFTSSLTAPLAASFTAQSVAKITGKWHSRSSRFRLIWIMVLVFGGTFGLAGIQPVPVIILAQAVNGLFLPFIVFIIILIINNRSVIPQGNPRTLNAALAMVFWITLIIGLLNIIKAVDRTFGSKVADSTYILLIVIVLSGGFALFTAIKWKLLSR